MADDLKATQLLRAITELQAGPRPDAAMLSISNRIAAALEVLATAADESSDTEDAEQLAALRDIGAAVRQLAQQEAGPDESAAAIRAATAEIVKTLRATRSAPPVEVMNKFDPTINVPQNPLAITVEAGPTTVQVPDKPLRPLRITFKYDQRGVLTSADIEPR